MLELEESRRPLLVHPVTSMGPMPTVFDPDGVYPYESFAETARRPVIEQRRFVTIENACLRVSICPDLGGKVHSILHKPSNREVLFVPASTHPVRILPRMGFVPGGIEVSFPISHTPVQIEALHCQTRRDRDRVYVWCGERELHFGLQWTVEYSLGERDEFLTQRVLLNNPTREARPWMSWSNAALPARPDTEFHFPCGPVLRHGDKVKTIDWVAEGPRRVADVGRMTGYFWLDPDVCAFGAYTPSLGLGLYHVADPSMVPGIKLWTYGLGPHEPWGKAASLSGESYIEIQGGPIRDQSIKADLAPEQRRSHIELWLPSVSPLELRSLARPEPALMPLDQIPLFDWPPREPVVRWLAVQAAFAVLRPDRLPFAPQLDENVWAPPGMDQLGGALRWAIQATEGTERSAWMFQLGAWLAGRNKVEEALAVLAQSRDDRARALSGRLHLHCRARPDAAAENFRAIQSEAVAMHPQVAIERDIALAALGVKALDERGLWFAKLANCADEWLIERRAAWLVDAGKPEEARRLIESTAFQLVHQRYERTKLWARLAGGQGPASTTVPSQLGEDDLAAFGAYREVERKS